jgi:DNA-binding transcriptional regulator LsrR (DeoR family)
MAKPTRDAAKKKTPAKASAETTAEERSRGSGRAKSGQQSPETPELDDHEKLATVCGYFCDEGLNATEIQKRMWDDHGVEMTREKPYSYVQSAAKNGWISFKPPQSDSLQRMIRETDPWLHDVSVVQTGRSEDVARRGAKMLLELLQQHYAGREVHIGFSGGSSLRMLARRFAELLREPARHLPAKIVFHALVAGFDVSDPTTDPNAFFTYFVSDPAMPFETSFVALHSPAMIEARLESNLRELPAIKEAYDRAAEIDIIVTSTSCWKDEHSMLRHYMNVAGASVAELEGEGCLGDVLWQPFGPAGPFELNTKIRAMTILRLSELSDLVEDGKHVLLVAGPCASCHRPKAEVVKAILDQEDRLITHLVTDSRCARAFLAAR